MSVVSYMPGHGRQGDNGGEPPDNQAMEARVSKLESIAERTGEHLAAIDTRLANMETQADAFKAEAFGAFATKFDVADAKNSIIMWVVSAILLAQLLPALLKKLGL